MSRHPPRGDGKTDIRDVSRAGSCLGAMVLREATLDAVTE
jgi:hypothetical protein